MKRFLAYLLALCVMATVLLTGCGGGYDSPAQPADTGEQQAQAPVDDATVPDEPDDTTVSGEEIVLRFPHWWLGNPGGHGIWINEAIEEFEANNPGIRIDGYTIAYADYVDNLVLSIAAGNAPDIVCLASFNIGPFIMNNQLTPLDDLIDMDAINQYFFEIQTEGVPARSPVGNTYIVSQLMGFYLPMYRPSVFEAAGMTFDATTPREFVDMVTEFTEVTGNRGYALMINPGNVAEGIFDLCIWIIGMGSHYVIDGRPAFNTPEMNAVFGYIKEMFDANVIVREADKPTYQRMFAEGLVGALIDGPWLYGMSVDWDPSVEGDFAIAPLPFPTNHAAAFFEGYSIPAASNNQEAAALLVEHLTSMEMQRRFVDLIGILPTRSDVFDAEFESNMLERWPWMQAFNEHAPYAVPFDPVGIDMDRDPELHRILYGALERVLYENADIGTALDEAQEAALAVLGLS